MAANGTNGRGVSCDANGNPTVIPDVLPAYAPTMDHRGVPIYGERCFWALIGAAGAAALILYFTNPRK